MCLEHKYYRKCCLTIDMRCIDRCPAAEHGLRCKILERVHPVEGYCSDCRRARNKVEDDVTTSPLYTKNDDYHRPWEPPKYKPIKSQPLSIPFSNYGQAEPERGRKSRRTPPPPLPEPVRMAKYTGSYVDRPQTPMLSDDEETERLRKYNRRRNKGQYDDIEYHDKARYHTNYPKTNQHLHPDPMQFRIASPRTVYKLQRKGMLPPMEQLQAMYL